MSGPASSVRDLDVVALATTLPGRAGDGTPEFVLTLAAALPSSRVVIVAPRIRRGPLIDRADGVDIRRVAYAASGRERVTEDAILPALRAEPRLALQLPRLLLGLLRETRRQVAGRKPDLVHAHWILPAGLLALVVSKTGGPPYVVTAHGADAYALDGKLGRALKKFVLRNALAVYPVSAEIAERLAPLAGDRLGPTFPMGVDTDRLREITGPLEPTTGRVLFVGRLSDKKGVDVLLRAVAEVPEVASVEIVGDGPDRAELEALSGSLGLDDRVRFVGHADRAAVLEAYRATAIVAVPSRLGAGGDQDGTPVVLMEAMALGLPVVASSLGGIAEQVVDGESGLLVPPDDVAALAGALRGLLADADRRARLGEGARTRAARFDIHEIGAELEDDLRRRLDGASA